MVSSLLFAGVMAGTPAISDVVRTKSASATFTSAFELRLVDGQIWWRPRSATASALEPWALLPQGGVPAPRSKVAAAKQRLGLRGAIRGAPFDSPAPLLAISADGDDLVAVDARSHVYFTKLPKVEWRDRFGLGPRTAPLRIPAGAAVALSLRTQPYQDIDGNAHPATDAVSTLYALTADGARLLFADGRQPTRFEGEICLPERGTFRGRAMSAQASTVAVLDDAGRVFTRLADFETLGNDPKALYSWRRERRTGASSNVRSLPPEAWRAQPPLPGPFAREITILWTGRDDAARELRVPTANGYYAKSIVGDGWRLVVTGVPRADATAPSRLPPRGPRPGTTLAGALWQGATTRLEQFDPLCPPAQVVVERDGERVTLALWMRENLERLPRGRELSGALLFPPSARGALANDVRALLGDTLVEVKVDIDERRVTVRSANQTRSEPRLTFTRH